MSQESTRSRRLATNTFHNTAALVGMHTHMRLVLVQGGEAPWEDPWEAWARGKRARARGG